MKILISFVIPLLFLAACRGDGGQVKTGRLTMTPALPRGGKPVNIFYRQDSGKPAGRVTGAVFYYAKKKLGMLELKLTDSGGVWHGSVLLPDSATAFGIAFRGGDNNGGKGYVFPVYDGRGKLLPGALASLSLFYMRAGAFLVGAGRDVDTALYLLKKDIAEHPGIKRDWEMNYLSALLLVKKDTARQEVAGQLGAALTYPDLREDELMDIRGLYGRISMHDKADSLGNVIRRRYPYGELAMEDMAAQFSRQKKADGMVALYTRFKNKFSRASEEWRFKKISSDMASGIARAYAGRKDYAAFMQYAALMTDPGKVISAYDDMARGLARDGDDLSWADTISRASLMLVTRQIADSLENNPGFDTTGRGKRLRMKYGGLADTYAMILHLEGKKTQAAYYQGRAAAGTRYGHEDINNRYAAYLVKAGDMTKARDEIAGMIRRGKGTDQMERLLKTAYVKEKRSVAGFGHYLAGLQRAGNEAIKAVLAGKMIREPAPAFDLPDLNGRQVSLASLKGKVVVLDFWATWCGPCKASFPGMQKAVERFKKDGDVVFLFANTWEKEKADARRTAVTDFIRQHGYDFHVLLDQPGADDTTAFQAVGAYGVRGIPAKFVIDPSGKIRFIATGFDGNTGGLAREMAMMIVMAKAG